MKQQDFYLIEKFISEKLSGEELKSFIDRMKADKQFSSEVEAYKASMLLLKELKKENLRGQLQQWDNELESGNVNEPSKGRIFPLFRLSIAAGFLILISAVAFLYYHLPQSASNTFAEANRPVITAPDRSPGTSQIEIYQNLETLYFNADYHDLIKKASSLSFPDRDLEIKRMQILSDAYYQTGAYPQAIENWRELRNLPDIDQWYLDESEWKILLIELEMRPFDPDLHLRLEKIAAHENHLYQENAGRISEQTNRGIFRWARWLGFGKKSH